MQSNVQSLDLYSTSSDLQVLELFTESREFYASAAASAEHSYLCQEQNFKELEKLAPKRGIVSSHSRV